MRIKVHYVLFEYGTVLNTAVRHLFAQQRFQFPRPAACVCPRFLRA